jgi:acetyl esterase/lipase
MRPHHAPYCALPLPSAPDADATLDFAIMRSPVTDPYERFLNAERLGRQEHVVRTREYFQPFEAVFEGNPPRVLERGDAEALPPMLIMVGADDDNVLPHVQEGFAAAYRAAGGQAEVVIYPDTGHMFEPGLQTDRAVASVRDFIARQAAQTGGA